MQDPFIATDATAATDARLADEEVLARWFELVEEDQFALNRRAATRAAGLADVMAFARSRPWIYALPGDAEPEKTAERCAVLEASARLFLSETAVRSLAHTAESARSSLPLLWSRAYEGFASLAQVAAAVSLLPRFQGADAGALAAFDRALSDAALSTSPAGFRVKANQLARRLAPQAESTLHALAFERRRVHIERADDGMSWVIAYVTTHDAVAIGRCLTSTAKHLQKAERDGRTRDQVRADLLTAWLRRTGTATAVKTKIFVTIPLDRLAPESRASARRGVAPRVGLDLNVEPFVIGEDVIDESTAMRLLLEAGSFTRVITDPVTGVVLDMDRRARFVTRAQREWLVLTHGLCTRDGCRRSAVGADIDHWREFGGRERGPTDLDNLHPFCSSDHRIKGRTRIRYRRRGDGSVQFVSPTGFETAAGNGSAAAPSTANGRPSVRVEIPRDPPF